MSVRVLGWDVRSASGTLVQSLSAVPTGSSDDAPQPPDDASPGAGPTSRDLPSHVELEGDRLLVAVRTADLIVAYVVAADGSLALDGATRLPGAWPRHFAVVDGAIIVAEQVGGALVAIAPGAPGAGTVLSTLAMPAPACVVVARHARPQDPGDVRS